MPTPTKSTQPETRWVLHARLNRDLSEQVAVAKARLRLRGNGDLIERALDLFFEREGIVPPARNRHVMAAE